MTCLYCAKQKRKVKFNNKGILSCLLSSIQFESILAFSISIKSIEGRNKRGTEGFRHALHYYVILNSPLPQFNRSIYSLLYFRSIMHRGRRGKWDNSLWYIFELLQPLPQRHFQPHWSEAGVSSWTRPGMTIWFSRSALPWSIPAHASLQVESIPKTFSSLLRINVIWRQFLFLFYYPTTLSLSLS